MEKIICSTPLPNAESSKIEFLGNFTPDYGRMIIVREQSFKNVANALPNDLWVRVLTNAKNSSQKMIKKSHLIFCAEKADINLFDEQPDGTLAYRTDLMAKFDGDELTISEMGKETPDASEDKPKDKRTRKTA